MLIPLRNGEPTGGARNMASPWAEIPPTTRTGRSMGEIPGSRFGFVKIRKKSMVSCTCSLKSMDNWLVMAGWCLGKSLHRNRSIFPSDHGAGVHFPWNQSVDNWLVFVGVWGWNQLTSAIEIVAYGHIWAAGPTRLQLLQSLRWPWRTPLNSGTKVIHQLPCAG